MSSIWVLYIVVPYVLTGLVVFGAGVNAFLRNQKHARLFHQVCKLSDVSPMEFYKCEPPIDGALSVIIKESKDSKQKNEIREIKGQDFLALKHHPGWYPPKAPRFLSFNITEYYVGDGFVPISLGRTDPLEVASALFRLEKNRALAVIAREAGKLDKEDAGLVKAVKQVEKTSGLIVMVLLAVFVVAIISGVGVYMVMKNSGVIETILNGLKSMGVIP